MGIREERWTNGCPCLTSDKVFLLFKVYPCLFSLLLPFSMATCCLLPWKSKLSVASFLRGVHRSRWKLRPKSLFRVQFSKTLSSTNPCARPRERQNEEPGGLCHREITLNPELHKQEEPDMLNIYSFHKHLAPLIKRDPILKESGLSLSWHQRR